MKENSIEDIECIQEFLEYSQDIINDMDYERPVDVTIYQNQINSLDHILSDYKRVLKENEELKYKYDKALTDVVKATEKKKTEGRKNGKTIEVAMQLSEEILNLPKCKLYGIKNCKNRTVLLTREAVIPVQKVKDKIKEYKKILSDCNKAKDIDRIKSINERILELEELLDKEEK